MSLSSVPALLASASRITSSATVELYGHAKFARAEPCLNRKVSLPRTDGAVEYKIPAALNEGALR